MRGGSEAPVIFRGKTLLEFNILHKLFSIEYYRVLNFSIEYYRVLNKIWMNKKLILKNS